uniref:Integrase catalytic domain-containing protein n=1 Tax=Fagus sylvatica TaxID=28930 RepID=A0A2N9FKP3_FAGSY
MSSLPALTEGEEEEKAKPLPPPDSHHCQRRRANQDANQVITTTTAEEEYAGPMVEGLSIHTITGEEDSTTTPPTRHCQQGEEAKTWTCVPLLQRVSNNSDEEIELPSDILEALERQDEGSKPNIEELEIVNLANEGEEPREVKIGTRCTTEQKEGTHRTVERVPRDLRLNASPSNKHCDRMKPEVILKIKEGSGKAIEGRIPEHSNLFGLGSQYSPGARRRMEKLESTNAVFSFMDGFSGYNQIKMAEEDKSKTAFVTHWGTFVYDVMPFEVYVDDMIAKSRTAQDHLTDLRKLFQRLKKYQLRLKPEQVFKPYEACPRQRQRKRSEASWEGLTYIARFIAQLTATCEPLFKLLRKDVKIKWTEDCQRAFDKIKEYLLNPPILVPPTPGRPLILYLTVQEASMGCMLGQQDETGKKEQAIYYLSKKFTEPETRYLLVEKTCCALGLGLQEAETVHALLHHLVGIPDGPDQAIKGQAIADYLADYPSEQLELNGLRIPRRRRNDSRRRQSWSGGSFTLMEQRTLSEHASSVCKQALEFGAYELEVFGDSLLIVSQTNGEWQARDPKLIPYQRYISRLVPKFKHVQTCHKCQMYQNSKNAPPQYLHTMASPWPFSAWGMDVIGAITPKASNGHEFILVAIDYFTKWVEACSFKNVTQVAVTRFVKNNIICRYGMPEMLITDNASNLKQPHDGPAMPAVQDPAPQLCSIPSKDERSRRSCQQELRTSVGATPYSLVYGMEAVLPVEVEIPSLRILSTRGRIERAYNKKARPRTFQPGDLVLKKRNMALSDPRGKFAPSYEGPYVVKKAFSGGAIILADMDGEEFRSPINSDSVIKYHV